jgi:hypothetical protein
MPKSIEENAADFLKTAIPAEIWEQVAQVYDRHKAAWRQPGEFTRAEFQEKFGITRYKAIAALDAMTKSGEMVSRDGKNEAGHNVTWYKLAVVK